MAPLAAGHVREGSAVGATGLRIATYAWDAPAAARALSASNEKGGDNGGAAGAAGGNASDAGGSGKPRAFVLALHGHAVHARYEFIPASKRGGPHDDYSESIIARLNAEGMSVHAYDQQSFGLSESRVPGFKGRGFVKRFDDLVDDCVVMAEKLRAEADALGVPLYLLACSMGGCVGVRTMQRRPKLFDGAVLVAPMLSLEQAKRQPANAVLLPVVGLLSRVWPTLRLPAGAVNTKFPFLQEEMDRDPRCLSSRTVGTTARMANEYLHATEACRRDVGAMTTPFLTLHSHQDTSVDPESSEHLHAHAGARDKDVKWFDGMWHNLLLEPGKDEVLDEIVSWYSARAPPA